MSLDLRSQALSARALGARLLSRLAGRSRGGGSLHQRWFFGLVESGLAGDPVFELAHPMTKPASHQRKPLGAEDQKDRDQHDECVDERISKHLGLPPS